MKTLALLFSALLAITTGAFAAAPATNAPPAAPAPAQAAKTNVTSPAATTPGKLKLDDYINDLATTLKLSDPDKKEVEGFYVADGDKLKAILNNDALSPLQKAQEVSDVRDARNTKIQGVLGDVGLQHEFLRIEAKYRVALTELAAKGELVAAPAAPDKKPADKPAAK